MPLFNGVRFKLRWREAFGHELQSQHYTYICMYIKPNKKST
jgi:hypothetical protein